MIAEKLQQLNQIKEDIKLALIEKGLLAGTDMTEYASLIKNIAGEKCETKTIYPSEFYMPIGPYFDTGIVADETCEIEITIKLHSLHRNCFVGYLNRVSANAIVGGEENTPLYFIGTSGSHDAINFGFNYYNNTSNQPDVLGPLVCLDIFPELNEWYTYKVSWGKVIFNNDAIFDINTCDPLTKEVIGESPSIPLGTFYINTVHTYNGTDTSNYTGTSGDYDIKNLKIWKSGELVGDFRYYNNTTLINVVDNSLHPNISSLGRAIESIYPVEIEAHGLIYADVTEESFSKLEEINDIYYIVHKISVAGPIEAIYKGEEKLISAGDTIINVDSSGSLLFMSLEVNIDINSDYTIPETNITTNNNELYFVYDNRDRNAWYGFALTLASTKDVAIVSKGHLSDSGDYIEDEIINDSLVGATLCYGFLNHDYDYVVLKISGNIKTWTISSTSIILNNNIKPSGVIQRIVEVVADLPLFTGPGVNSNHLKKFTLKNATPTTLASAFSACYCLEEINFVNCDFSKVTTIYNIFSNCWSLKSIDLSQWGLSNKLTNISSAFSNCRSVETINLENVDTSNCSTFASLFNNCYSLKEIKGLNDLNASKVTIFTEVFANCLSIKSIDLSNLTFGKITSMGGSTGTFGNCYSLESLKLPIMNLSGCSTVKSLFANCWLLIFDYDLKEKIKYFGVSSACTNAAQMFQYCYNLTDIDISSWDLSGCTDLNSMFSNCWNLKSIKLPSCKMKGAFNSFFANCYSLEEADLSTLDFNNTSVSFANLFDGCWSIKSIKCPINALPTTIALMFNYCKSLPSIEGFENIDTSACTTMTSLFSYCYNLKEVNLSNLTIGANCTTVASMFRDCRSLEEIVFNPNLSHNTSKLTTTTYFLVNNYNLKKFECMIPISTITSLSSGFGGLMNLKEFITNWDLSKCTSMSSLGEAVSLESFKLAVGPNAGINISSATRLSKQEIINLINCLPKVSAKTLTLGNLRGVLTADELKLATDKGWTVA